MAYRVVLSRTAVRNLDGFPEPARRRVMRVIVALAGDPRPNDTVKLTGDQPVWRVRVGPYRVVYEVYDRDQTVLVMKVLRRNEATYRR